MMAATAAVDHHPRGTPTLRRGGDGDGGRGYQSSRGGGDGFRRRGGPRRSYHTPPSSSGLLGRGDGVPRDDGITTLHRAGFPRLTMMLLLSILASRLDGVASSASDGGGGLGGGGSLPASPPYREDGGAGPLDVNPDYVPWGQQRPPPSEPNADTGTYEDASAAWRREQLAKSQSLTEEQLSNPNDESGRMKLLANVSRGSLFVWFFVLTFRAVHHIESADKSFKGVRRLMMVSFPALLFVGNLAGCIAVARGVTAGAGGVSSASAHNTKRRMKFILNMNKFLEVLLFCYNLTRMTLWPNPYVPREVYVAGLFHNVLYVMASQGLTRVAWDAAHEVVGASMGIGGSGATDAGGSGEEAFAPYGEDDGGMGGYDYQYQQPGGDRGYGYGYGYGAPDDDRRYYGTRDDEEDFTYRGRSGDWK